MPGVVALLEVNGFHIERMDFDDSEHPSSSNVSRGLFCSGARVVGSNLDEAAEAAPPLRSMRSYNILPNFQS